jgi:hypothetical protein
MVQKATINQISNRTIVKPQQYFIDKIDNSKLPFLPKLRNKVNSKSPLAGIFTNKIYLKKIFFLNLF